MKSKLTKRKVISMIVVFFILLLIYLSCDVIPIEEMEKGFDPKRYARELWFKLQDMMNEGLGYDAVEVLNTLDENPELAHQKFAKVVGVSNYRYYIIQGVGEIVEIKDDGILVKVRENRKVPDLFLSNHIFGNGIVNATGIAKMEDFDRIIDFNLTATELNKIVKEEVVNSFLKQLSKGAGSVGSLVRFIAVFTLLKDEEIKYPIEAIPLYLEIQGGF
ncbi:MULTISPECIES: DUF2291 domain-containing protein [Thermotoga]|uniref:Lipoprotein n=2 Tax=Thermotoga TaxID=2335 RepID=Q9X052_THEMA|nr:MULTISPECIES: DUF2291 domain-containing protein [Thermotoga]HBF10990.1 DUF2291 domain-containing protein [Thermotoga neapolitana]AAD36036.1 hypothetical protein TM_0957 [Thermotoga maritima MSB8]ACM23795.1 Putative uncharacterized protein [Thermotoga neapolitana DSM 4359]AGL49884.1 hypothetical protein Tmari_0959 [Thermotoga maritima MSB8]AHD19129.1 hypothetical protein THEMA_09560 [Thermotoga maritima MSB8]